jgi:NADPH-dependent curcumin reductase CurA
MAGNINRQILLKSRPEGPPGLENFELVGVPVPEPGEGEVRSASLSSLDRPCAAA